MLLALKRPFLDGTTHLRFAPTHPWRRWVTGAGAESSEQQAGKATTAQPYGRGHRRGGAADGGGDAPDYVDRTPKAPLTWAERLKRVFGMEITVCPHCGGRLRVIAGGRLRT